MLQVFEKTKRKIKKLFFITFKVIKKTECHRNSIIIGNHLSYTIKQNPCCTVCLLQEARD